VTVRHSGLLPPPAILGLLVVQNPVRAIRPCSRREPKALRQSG
jgi:hypothetical protein